MRSNFFSTTAWGIFIIELHILTPILYACLAFNRKEAPCTNLFELLIYDG